MINHTVFIEHLSVSCVVTFLASILCVIFVKPLAIRVGLVDIPNIRKLHQGAIPLIGGIAILFGLGIGLLTLNISLVEYRTLIAGGGILVFLGVLDDFQELSPYGRLLAQIFAAFLITFFGHVYFRHLGNLLFFGPINLGKFGIPFSIIAIVALINAINMLDGLDGLAGSIVSIQFVFLGIFAFLLHKSHDFSFIVLIVSALLAFLLFNFPFTKRRKAKVFMGDAGSMLLGLLLSWFVISLSQTHHQAAAAPVLFLWIIALPLLDLAAVVFIRLMKGKSPFHADREHLHHILQKAKLSDLTIVLFVAFLCVIFGLIGLIGYLHHWSEPILFVTFIAVFFIYLIFVHYGLRNTFKSSP